MQQSREAGRDACGGDDRAASAPSAERGSRGADPSARGEKDARYRPRAGRVCDACPPCVVSLLPPAQDGTVLETIQTVMRNGAETTSPTRYRAGQAGWSRIVEKDERDGVLGRLLL